MHKHPTHLNAIPEDIGDVLKLIEKSYDIKFEGSELQDIRTFGQLTDHILSKIKLDNRDDCTGQQAFYKLRAAIEKIKIIEKSAISPETPLTELFPARSRKEEIKKIESELQLDLKALRPRYMVTNSLAIVLLLSIAGLFIQWQYALMAVLVSLGALWVAEKTGNEFRDRTLGELTDRMTRENYTKSRRDAGTMNIKEVQNKIEELFIDSLGLETKSIDRDTVIV